MIKQLAHICIHSADLEKTKDFYLEALGLAVAFEFERDGEVFGFYINLGNATFIEVFKGEPAATGNIRHMAIEVDDLDGLIDRIRSCGYEVSDKKTGSDNSWQAWVTDPNGVRIEFHEYTVKSCQLTGGACVVNR